MRKLESEIESLKGREEAAAQARAEILRLAQARRTNGGPSDETADEMIQAIREWRETL